MTLNLSCETNKTILFTNCNVYGRPDINAILCNNGKISQLLPSGNVQAGKRINLHGGWVYPGFTDAHMHFSGLGWSLEAVDLVGTPSKEAVLDKILKSVKDTPKGTWIRGRGWDQNDWPVIEYPTAADLDNISPNHPVIFRRIDGHAAWANSLAMKLAGISSQTEDITGGIILRDESGNPNGIFIDNAMELIETKIPPTTKKDIRRYLEKAQSLLNTLGITSIHDAGTSKEEIEVMKEMISSNDLSLRVYTMLHNNPDDYEDFLKSGPETENPFIKVQAVKLYMDGALGSRGAALLEPYSDDLNNKGLLIISADEHESLVQKLSKAGFQSNTHGIGDRAVRTILDSYEKMANFSLRNRIEHAQIVHPDDIPRFKELNVIPAMQSTHCTSDMYWADERLGNHRLNEAYAWQSLIKSGVVVPAGSDAPVEFPDPLVGIYAAVTRQDKKGWPKNGWQKHERMTLEQAIKSYTEWAAYASFEEDIKGKIELGFYADFTVLDRELLSHNPLEILNSTVIYTIINGKIVYQK
ncbi:MAG: amidohydrolase family protein [Candidatus Marinimicrobia bacterium]|nr:amidohydrolase family protein [Candidatus Neomarinimicrobiota bacterium]MBT3999617.1 amidohydrolase family protein [Candidatus Neomarinimicrobiota bacterium]MBT4957783.1 amidohydrolase family protein [Candidatus Neomarinimicrobiota bacterium]MBT5461467.1 amidohydrolase family protein [Candidatus Neomarinimicrobiota bacterium]MBT7822324.1 amidohydrolase family protein [Candidatus Neomarinimicrobiota bacterium]